MSDKNLWDRVRGAFSGQTKPAAAARRTETDAAPKRVVRIDFDMMLKGSTYNRPTGKVKQYGVTVDGATRVITSGDFVDRDTYDALIKAGAIRPMTDAPVPDVPQQIRKHQRQAR